MRRSVKGLLGGLGNSSLSGATGATGVEVEAGCPLRELQNGSFVRLMGVCGGCACACEPEGVAEAEAAIGERARAVELSGERCFIADMVGVAEDSVWLLLSVVVLAVVVAVVVAVLLLLLLVVVVGKLRLCNRLLP